MEEQRDEKNHVDCCGATSGAASMMLQVILDMIPHKIGIFIFPIVICVLHSLLAPFNWYIRKKTVKASTDKERMEANSSARVLCVVVTIAGHRWNYELLYPLFLLCAGNVNGSKVTVDIGV